MIPIQSQGVDGIRGFKLKTMTTASGTMPLGFSPHAFKKNERSGSSILFSLIISFLVVFSIIFNGFGQLSTKYNYSYVGTNTWANLASPMTTLQTNGNGGTDAIFVNQAIGFTFKFNCVDYTNIGISANGFIWFGTGSCATNQYLPLSSTTGESGTVAGIVSAFGANHVNNALGYVNTLRTKLTGTAPNRVFTIEWRGMDVSGTVYNTFDAQIKLFETSNDIEIRLYDNPYFLMGANAIGQVGMRTSTADFLNRTTAVGNLCNTTAGATNTATCSIVAAFACDYAYSGSGPITFKYAFNGNCCTLPTVAPSGASVGSVSVDNATLNWTPGNGASDIVFVKAGSSITTDPVNNTSYTANTSFGAGSQIGTTGAYAVYSGSAGTTTVSSLAPNTTYYYAVYTYNPSGPCYLTPSGATGSFTTGSCVSPTIQPSAPSLSCIDYTTMNLRFTRGNGTHAIVVARAGSTVNADPAYNTNYTASSVFGSGSQIGTGNFVVYTGNDAGIVTVPLTGLTPGTTYYFKIYEYNAPTNCYNTTGPATISGTTRGDGVYTSSTTTQNTANVLQGSLAQDVIKLTIVMGGTSDQAGYLNSITFTTTGTTNTATDLTNARIFYTGNSNTFSDDTQFGQTFTTFGTNTATGTFALLPGNNYFWIAYDVKLSATAGNVIDATVTSFNITDGNGTANYSPTPTAPVGSRPIVAPGGTCPITTPSARCSGSGCNTSLSQGEYIANISFGTTVSGSPYPTSSGCAPAISYVDMTPTNVFSVSEGSTYTLTMNMSTWFSVGYEWAVWIDWNGNGDLRDAGERYPSGTATVDEWTTLSITVPAGVAPGNHTMRVWSQEFSYPPNDCPYRTSQGPLTTSLGEIIDVTVIVPNASGVAAPPASGGVSCATVAPTVTTPIYYTQYDAASSLTATGNNLLWYTSPTGGTGSSTAPTPSTLLPGTYTFYVSQTNASGSPICEGPRIQIAVVIDPPPPPSAPIPSATQPTCTVATGSIDLTGLPANGSWTINPNTLNGSGTSTTIDPVSPGTYTYTVTDQNGCISPASAPVTIDPQPPTPNPPTIGVITEPTSGTPTGSVILEDLPTDSWTVDPGAIAGAVGITSTTVSGLAPGSYTYTVTNIFGCTSAASAPVLINVVLPVELIGFSGYCTDERKILEWSTASEHDNDHFTLEFSIDQENWDTLCIVQGVGNSTAIQEYSCIDERNTLNETYYRLSQTDIDGQQKFALMIFLEKCAESIHELVILPNPSSGYFTVVLNGASEHSEKSVKIFSMNGELIRSYDHFDSLVDLSEFSEGVYLLQLTTANETFIERLILNR